MKDLNLYALHNFLMELNLDMETSDGNSGAAWSGYLQISRLLSQLSNITNIEISKPPMCSALRAKSNTKLTKSLITNQKLQKEATDELKEQIGINILPSKSFLENIFPLLYLLPDTTIDFVPTITVPYECLPDELKEWEKRDGKWPPACVRSKIKENGGQLVAKMEKNLVTDGMDEHKISYRLSVNPGMILECGNYSCDPKRVLIILKDIRNIALDIQIGGKNVLRSYLLKNSMMWCMQKNDELTEEGLLMNTLELMGNYFSDGYMPDFFDEGSNLIANINDEIKADVKMLSKMS